MVTLFITLLVLEVFCQLNHNNIIKPKFNIGKYQLDFWEYTEIRSFDELREGFGLGIYYVGWSYRSLSELTLDLFRWKITLIVRRKQC